MWRAFCFLAVAQVNGLRHACRHTRAIMEMRQMRYFLALADELDAARAARLCGLSVSGLGRHISDLEESLGCSLFRRRAGRVALTAAGAVFYRRAQALLASAAEAAGEARAAAAASRARIRLGHFGAWWRERYARGLRRYEEQSPATRLHESCYVPAGVLAALRGGEVDVALLEWADLGLRIDFNIRRIESLPALVVLPAAHKLAGRRSVSFADLRGEAWVTWDERHFPGRGHRFLEAAGKARFVPCIAGEAPSEEGMLERVKAGDAIGTLPAGQGAEVPKGLSFVPLRPSPLAFPVFVAWRKDADHEEELDRFASALLESRG